MRQSWSPEYSAAARLLPVLLLPVLALTAGRSVAASSVARPIPELAAVLSAPARFLEPLVPVGGAAAEAGDDQALARALGTRSSWTDTEDFSALEQFLSEHPHSRWAGSLLVNLGLVQRRQSSFTAAQASWERAWTLLQTSVDPAGRRLGDQALGELANLYAWSGQREKLAGVLRAAAGREVSGPATEKLAMAQEALALLQTEPATATACGPLALAQLAPGQNAWQTLHEQMKGAAESGRGFSLTELQALAARSGLDYQMAYRNPGAPVLLHSLVHWKVNHYGAVMAAEAGGYRCADAGSDAFYGGTMRLSAATLDREASGYFLVPRQALPAGWRPVEAAEGGQVRGAGITTYQDPTETGKCAPSFPSCDGAEPMAHASVHALVVGVKLSDRPVRYTPPRGPAVGCDVVYSQRDAFQPATFNYTNMGPKWTLGWLSYVQVIDYSQQTYFGTDGVPTSYAGGNMSLAHLTGVSDTTGRSADIMLYQPGGGVRFFPYDTASGGYLRDTASDDQLVLVAGGAEQYEVRHPSGSKEVYAKADGTSGAGRKLFLSQEVDPQGNRLTFGYDSRMRLTTVTDALGQVTTLFYDLNGSADPSEATRVTRVTDPFGRTATFAYDSAGRLSSITDIIGIVSSFAYDGNTDRVVALTTPYGRTSFDGGINGTTRWVETTDPLGQKERVESRDGPASGIDFSDNPDKVPDLFPVFNLYLNSRNTFYWDKLQMSRAPGDYTQAQITHWLHAPSGDVTSGIVESTKQPNENRVWHYYGGQLAPGVVTRGMSSAPTMLAQKLDDGTTRLTQSNYNALGRVTQTVDPVGRTTNYAYAANGLDLLQVSQVNQMTFKAEPLVTYQYAADGSNPHLPVAVTDAAGRTTHYVYNAFGQLLSVTNPKNETTTFTYGDTESPGVAANTNAYVRRITGPVPGSTVDLTYDSLGRVHTATDADGTTLTIDHDVLDRVTKVTYPDGTTSETKYQWLDPVSHKDRLGRVGTVAYNALRQVLSETDALGRVTHYQWCLCGALSQLTDALGQVTSWVRDNQGRVTSKASPDGRVTVYAYDSATSRVKTATDPMGQVATFSYNPDDTVSQVDYSQSSTPTPSVSFAYDPSYARLTQMTDAIGVTTYQYYPINAAAGGGRLQSVTGPWANSQFTIQYDELGRPIGQTLDGVASSVQYDTLGRVTAQTNALGNFSYTYVSPTSGRLASFQRPNGVATQFAYFDVTQDLRLKSVLNLLPDGQTTLSRQDYTYRADGQIMRWTQTAGAAAVREDLVYDAGNRLAGATFNTVQADQSLSLLRRYRYAYDAANNRVAEKIDDALTGATYAIHAADASTGAPAATGTNQLLSRQDGGAVLFQGQLTQPGTVTVNGTPATLVTPVSSLDAGGTAQTPSFTANVTLAPGTNAVSVVATDASGHQRVNRYQMTIAAGGVNETLTYDGNGNLLRRQSHGVVTASYQWDALNRLVQITQPAQGATPERVSTFLYDGLGRRVGITESVGGVTTSDKRYLWVGESVAEERDSTGATITKRFLSQGVQIGSANYYYTRDHLGSIRELTDAAGTVQARYDYDPYGRRTRVAGVGTPALEADFGFTGHFFHQATGLSLTHYRAYDPALGRWLSQDPIAEAGGLNLYAYVGNNPVNGIDQLGLFSADASFKVEWFPLKLDLPIGNASVPIGDKDLSLPNSSKAGVGLSCDSQSGCSIYALAQIGYKETDKQKLIPKQGGVQFYAKYQFTGQCENSCATSGIKYTAKGESKLGVGPAKVSVNWNDAIMPDRFAFGMEFPTLMLVPIPPTPISPPLLLPLPGAVGVEFSLYNIQW